MCRFWVVVVVVTEAAGAVVVIGVPWRGVRVRMYEFAFHVL